MAYCYRNISLNSPINDQIAKLVSTGLDVLRPSVLNVKRDTTGTTELLIESDLLKKGNCNLVFAHPESFLSCSFGRELLKSKEYEENVRAVVIDEAHCILEW